MKRMATFSALVAVLLTAAAPAGERPAAKSLVGGRPGALTVLRYEPAAATEARNHATGYRPMTPRALLAALAAPGNTAVAAMFVEDCLRAPSRPQAPATTVWVLKPSAYEAAPVVASSADAAPAGTTVPATTRPELGLPK